MIGMRLLSTVLTLCFFMPSVSYASLKEEQKEELAIKNQVTSNSTIPDVESLRLYFGSRSRDIPFSFSNQPIDEEDCANIKMILMDQPFRLVNFNGCTGIGDCGLKLLADAFATMPNLTRLDLANIGMTDDGCGYLCQKLKNKIQSDSFPFKTIEIRQNGKLGKNSLLELLMLKQAHPHLIIVDDFSPETNFQILSLLKTKK